MLDLFATLKMGAQSLQAQRTAVQVTGQNLANVNNPAYARQRVTFATSSAVPTQFGPQSTGVEVTGIQQLRDSILDGQIRQESSSSGYLNTMQSGLEQTQGYLGESVNQSSTAATSTSDGSTSPTGLGDDINNLFSAFQSLAASPDSMTQRQALVGQAQTLASRFNQVSQKLGVVKDSLNTSIGQGVKSANQLLSDISDLNGQITQAEAGGGTANDLRDQREQKLETLAGYVNTDVGTDANGALTVSIGGVQMVDGSNQLDSLQTYDAGNGQILVQAATAGTGLPLTGGSIQGAIDTRDCELKTLSGDLDKLAFNLITQVNIVHSNGFNFSGGNGANFFTGTSAATISVNGALANDPTLIQAAGVSGATGDNTVALQLANLATQPITDLGNQTFSGSYSQTVADLGQSLQSVNQKVADQGVLQTMLGNQREAVSGVSLDEEMTNLVQFQQAYNASARLISTADQMLQTLIAIQ